MNAEQITAAETPELVRRHVKLRIQMSHTRYLPQSILDEDYLIVDELVRREVLDK